MKSEKIAANLIFKPSQNHPLFLTGMRMHHIPQANIPIRFT
jgi:hypothetical protein